MKLVMIEWVDSAFCVGWTPKESVKGRDVSRICAVGILIHRDWEKVTIAQGVSDKGDAGDGITIPLRSVKRIRQLEVKAE